MNKCDTAALIESVNDFYKKSYSDNCHRYVSFDLCYGYFYNNRHNLCGDNLEMSCYVLWSYLASWGMLRGSSFLLQKTPEYLVNLINYISTDGNVLFDIDVDKYNDANVKNEIINGYNCIYELLGGDVTKPTSTLITKIMLGVFGCIPAYDRYFCDTFNTLYPNKGFGSKKVTDDTLNSIYDFYSENQKCIDDLRSSCNLKRFNDNPTDKTGTTDTLYSRAKIIDMYGFQSQQP